MQDGQRRPGTSSSAIDNTCKPIQKHICEMHRVREPIPERPCRVPRKAQQVCERIGWQSLSEFEGVPPSTVHPPPSSLLRSPSSFLPNHWKLLGGLSGASWGLSGATLEFLGASWDPLEGCGLGRDIGGNKLQMSIRFPPPGPLLGASWTALGASWAVLGPCWAVLGLSWGPPSWGGLASLQGRLGLSEARNSENAKILQTPN